MMFLNRRSEGPTPWSLLELSAQPLLTLVGRCVNPVRQHLFESLFFWSELGMWVDRELKRDAKQVFNLCDEMRVVMTDREASLKIRLAHRYRELLKTIPSSASRDGAGAKSGSGYDVHEVNAWS